MMTITKLQVRFTHHSGHNMCFPHSLHRLLALLPTWSVFFLLTRIVQSWKWFLCRSHIRKWFHTNGTPLFACYTTELFCFSILRSTCLCSVGIFIITNFYIFGIFLMILRKWVMTSYNKIGMMNYPCKYRGWKRYFINNTEATIICS